MSRKLSNEEWEEFINQYYESGTSLTINAFCKEHGASKQQFHYHKKRIRERKNKEDLVFQKISYDNKMNSCNGISTGLSEVKIAIGNATISIPVRETTLISSIIKE